MNILHLGLMYNKNNEKRLIGNSKSGLGIASNLLQYNFLKGINNGEHNIQAQTFLPVGNYPKLNKKYYYCSNNYTINKDILINELHTINIPILKNVQRLIDLKKNISNWIKNVNSSEPKVVIIYDLYLPFLQVIKWIKTQYKDITVILIVPDLIGKFRNQQQETHIQNKIMNFMSSNYIELMNNADGYIIVSEQIRSFIENKPYLVVNGIVSGEEPENNKISESILTDKTIFMYAGLLSKQYEVDKMAQTFHELAGDDFELWVCGYGELEEKFEKTTFTNVKYFGTLSKEEVGELEKLATVMINPRPNDGEYTKYSFPSKNLEYLLSGKPVITHKLDSFPELFDNVFDYIDNNKDALASKILKYTKLSSEKIQIISMRNRKFALENYGVNVQGDRINKFIKEVVAETCE